MRRGAIYSSSRNLPTRTNAADGAPKGSNGSQERDKLDSTEKKDGREPFRKRLIRWFPRHERILMPLSGALAALLVLLLAGVFSSQEDSLDQGTLDERILETLEQVPPERSRAAEAHDVIGPSVVRITQLGAGGQELGDPEEAEEVLGVGTGVVIDAEGVVLTSLHVVLGAERIGVRFADGFETEAEIVSQDPSNDLAVLQVDVMPEGVPPATVVSTDGLALGDEVIAVGNPFGIGPSVSYGVVSGLDRRYAGRNGETVFDNLIQFDAAANPGNSGGPLVNRDGELLGIVSSIYNPTEQRVFIGIGFAVPIETAASAAGESPF
ncbi:MAG: S1C family serine protease [Spirochaetaceae bacterium]